MDLNLDMERMGQRGIHLRQTSSFIPLLHLSPPCLVPHVPEVWQIEIQSTVEIPIKDESQSGHSSLVQS